MRAIAPYLVGGILAVIAVEYAPSLLRQVVSPASALTETNTTQRHETSAMNRGDRLAAPRPAITAETNMTVAGKRGGSADVGNPIVISPLGEPARRPTPPAAMPNSSRKMPVGCESSFSPVASPSLAHHTGRCVS